MENILDYYKRVEVIDDIIIEMLCEIRNDYQCIEKFGTADVLFPAKPK